jgi:myo-inositol-1(or 4)-monophosphatase
MPVNHIYLFEYWLVYVGYWSCQSVAKRRYSIIGISAFHTNPTFFQEMVVEEVNKNPYKIHNMSKDLELAIKAAKHAGHVILEAYYKSKKITKKGVGDFVTATDVLAERIIIEELQPTGYSVFAEESGVTDNKSKKKWIIDPLDGTNNFIRGYSFFAVSIALLEDDKNLLLGVVYDPIANECYWAEKDHGAYVNGEKIQVNHEGGFEDAVLLIDHGRSEKSKKDYFNAVHKLTLGQGTCAMRHGSTALMLCYMARGKAEAFLSAGDEIYDYAGGLIIAKEAGAIISDWNGKPWDNSGSYILAVTPEVRTPLLEHISGIQQK